MIDGALIFIGGIAFGAPFWVALAWYRFCRTERPKISIEVSRQEIARLESSVVLRWLDARGLVWMPKGPEFRPKVKR